MSLRKDYSLSTNSPLTPIRNTSTPFPMRRKSILPSRSNSILSRRYSLSDVDCISPIQRNSTFFNQNNVSNLLKSPNNSRKSSENKEKLLINHQQMKYSTPGVFPIVHLNKPNLPILKEKSKNVNGELASPELCRQNSAEHNRLLLEKVVQNCSKLKTTGVTTITTTTTTSTATTANRSIDISTRSVLDALKEISRKRIHTSEELDYLDDGKRIRLDNNNDDLLLNLKRPRGESPPHESYQNSSKQQQVKKQCSMNEIVASQSSMEVKLSPPPPPPPVVAQASNENKQISRSRDIEVEVDVHRPSKKPNLVNAETQTQITENVKDVGVQSKESIPVSIEINKDNIEKSTIVETTSTTTTTVKSSSCLKVFDEAPLERARKDRLSVLMGIKRQSSDMKMSQEEKPITSILSSNINKHLKSPTSKHVTFNLESEPSSESNQQQIVEKTIASTVNNNNLSITQTTASITTPLISSVISETPKLPDKDIVQTSNETKIVPKITSSLNQPTTTQSIPTFNFTATTSVENSANSTKLINPVTSVVTATTRNMFDNSNKIGNIPITTTTTSSTPPKIGGFKFDLNPKSTTSASKFTLVTSTTTTKTTESSQKPTFFFGGVTKNTPTTHAILPTTTIAPKFSFTSSITTTTAAVTTTTPATSFTQSGFGGSGGFNFTPQTTQSFVNPVTTSTTVGLPTTFGNQPIKSNVFGTNPIVTTNTFGIQPTVSNIFGGITTQTTTAGTKSTFGVAQPTNIFGGIATTTAAVAVTTMVTTTASTFGIQPIQSTTFGSNPAPTFGTPGFNFGANNSFTNTNSIDKPSFGNLQTPQQSLFTPTTTTSPVAAATTTTTSIFNTNVFNSTNTTNNPPVFGLNNPPTTNIFGSLPAVTTAPQNPPPPPSFGFDVNKPSGFNTTSTTPAFGSTTFGTTNQNQPVFGCNLNNSNNNNNQPTQASSPPGGVFTFGTNTVNKPTGVFSFGQSEPPKPTFNFTANPTNSTVIGGGGSVNSSFTNGNVSIMFSIGSGGSSTPRARTQLKAKRRT